MKLPALSDSDEDRPAGWRHELTDLDLLRIPRELVDALDGTAGAVIDGMKLRRHDDRRITVEGHGGAPRWLR